MGHSTSAPTGPFSSTGLPSISSCWPGDQQGGGHHQLVGHRIKEGAEEQNGQISALEIYGGDGNDKLYGGAYDDRIYGGSGIDFIAGGPGNDYIDGGPGADLLAGNLWLQQIGWARADITEGHVYSISTATRRH